MTETVTRFTVKGLKAVPRRSLIDPVGPLFDWDTSEVEVTSETVSCEMATSEELAAYLESGE